MAFAKRQLRPIEDVASKDTECLFPGRLVNGEVINAFLRLVERRSCNRPSLPHVMALNTYFFPALKACPARQREGFDRIQRRHKNLNLLDFDIILVPVHEPRLGREGHWWLMVADIRTKTISAYDSVTGRDQTKDLEVMRAYLDYQAEVATPTRAKREWLLWKGRECPAQTNTTDCGILLCAVAAEISQGGPLVNFTVDTNEMRRKISRALRASAIGDDQPMEEDLFPGEVDWDFETLARELERIAPPVPMGIVPADIDSQSEWDDCALDDPLPEVAVTPVEGGNSAQNEKEGSQTKPDLLELAGMTEEEVSMDQMPASPTLSMSPGRLRDWVSVTSTTESFEIISEPETESSQLQTTQPMEIDFGPTAVPPEILMRSSAVGGESTSTPTPKPEEGATNRPAKTRGKRRTMKVQIPGTNTFKRINIRKLGLVPYKR
ncbi:uncharacterized protein LOC128984118 [Macrosteles quadrilineatus]|uniref:uncharacterized protein LOC128984118 n=1 Tax=Macrosteles quadrilineatus TaxID=74068 RepID=UPI0023E0A9D8|nr:uncharacterized protein LOC128984118 [Macrosteles quadrilineatus]